MVRAEFATDVELGGLLLGVGPARQRMIKKSILGGDPLRRILRWLSKSLIWVNKEGLEFPLEFMVIKQREELRFIQLRWGGKKVVDHYFSEFCPITVCFPLKFFPATSTDISCWVGHNCSVIRWPSLLILDVVNPHKYSTIMRQQHRILRGASWRIPILERED